MTKYIQALITSIFLIISSHLVAQEVTILGDDSYKPYIYKDDNGNPAGVYHDIIEAALKAMPEYKLKWKLTSWKRGLSDIEKGTAFAIVPPYYRPDSRPWIEPYSEDLLDEKVVLVCRQEVLKQERKNFPADYEGLSFGNNSGYRSLGDDFFQMVDDGKVNLVETTSTEANLKKLIAGRIDCYGNDRLVVASSLKDLGSALGQGIEVAVDVKVEKGYLGFSRDGDFSYKDDFVAKFNEAIKAMKAKGEIEQILNKYL